MSDRKITSGSVFLNNTSKSSFDTLTISANSKFYKK